MIITELYLVRPDGTRLVRTYSDAGKYITRDGAVYEEAIDPEEAGRVYEETDELIPVEEDTQEDKAEAYDILMGAEA